MNLSIEDLPGEVWRDIAGYDGRYQVSNKGRVKSFARREAAIMRAGSNAQGYYQIGFNYKRKRKNFLVHRLVMLTFSPIENPDEMEVNHIDFDVKNACLENLEWATPLHNTQHFHRSGRLRDLSKTTGARSHKAKFTDADIFKIREMFKQPRRGLSKVIAKQFGVSASTIEAINNGKTWKHLLPANQNTGEQP